MFYFLKLYKSPIPREGFGYNILLLEGKLEIISAGVSNFERNWSCFPNEILYGALHSKRSLRILAGINAYLSLINN